MQDPLDENQVDGEGGLASIKGTAAVLATCPCFKTGSNGTTPDLALRHTLEVLQLSKLGAIPWKYHAPKGSRTPSTS